MTRHPKGDKATILFSSVFGPYAQDDEFGSRRINPMELYHNQVTRAQGAFSLRIFHRSWGILFLQENVSAPSTVLDFPTRERFAEELRTNRYDVVGITSIVVNWRKVREMCRMVRELSPHSQIVVGGHVTAIPGLEKMIDADHIVRGEGVGWLRHYLGEDETAPIRHPQIASGFGHCIMGLKLPASVGSTAATIIPSVGCPMGCNFCTTSAFFGGKGKVTHFFKTGDELFAVMQDVETKSGLHSFFVMDENFLLDRKRAMRLLELMREHRKTWEIYVFSSANAIRKYTMDELVELGVTWVWMGLESPLSGYQKLQGSDTLELTRQLHRHGIRVLGSSIVGMEHHTPENIGEETEYAISHETDFHQFMLYTPLPGTPLYAQMEGEGRLLDVDLADIHGQYKFNWKHPSMTRDQSKEALDRAFQRDFERNGPSLYRICRTMLEGWRRYRHHPEARVRKRFERDGWALRTSHAGMLWAMERELRRRGMEAAGRVAELRAEIARELGPLTKIGAAILGPVFLWTTRREERRLAAGVTYEPQTFVERKNWVPALAHGCTCGQAHETEAAEEELKVLA
jgi:radical SAM superfamily enzyme YgiQ (UPF0313 family)